MNDYSTYEKRLAEIRMKGMELRAEEAELRFNPYHDPTNGRFTTVGGGSGSFLYSKGGKSFYVVSGEQVKSNAKYNGFSVTDSKGKTESFTVVDGRVRYADQRKYDGFMGSGTQSIYQKAYDRVGSVDGIISQINKVGKGKASIISDDDVEKMRADYKLKREAIDKEMTTLLSGNKHSVNRHRAYWSAM